MRRILTMFLLICFFVNSANAQREYNVCDSTFYNYVGDTTIVAGKRHLYFLTTTGQVQFADFTSTDTAEYIRDFDVVQPDLWYTLVGLRYIGAPTRLYISKDRGASWLEDTSFYSATRYHPTLANSYYNSINQLQSIGNGDTIILFVGYYESGVVYSTDKGVTWSQWFRNLVTHYQGFLECNNKYYLYGFEGDAFRPWMFAFDKSLLFSPDTSGAWVSFANRYHPNCSGVNNPNCIYADPNSGRCEQYTYMKTYIDSMCTALSVHEMTTNTETIVYPNPNNGIFELEADEVFLHGIKVYDMMGRTVIADMSTKATGKYTIVLPINAKGMYTVLINYKNGMTVARRVVVE